MSDDWEEQVRIRAYEIWEREGRPDGGAEQRWLQAEEELRAKEAAIGKQDLDDDHPREPTGTGTVATGTVVDPDLAGTSR